MNRIFTLLCALLWCVFVQAQHPCTFFTKNEAEAVKKNITLYPVLSKSFTDIKNSVDLWIGKDVDVPFPKDPAGGYTHDKHKTNYTLLLNFHLINSMQCIF